MRSNLDGSCMLQQTWRRGRACRTLGYRTPHEQPIKQRNNQHQSITKSQPQKINNNRTYHIILKVLQEDCTQYVYNDESIKNPQNNLEFLKRLVVCLENNVITITKRNTDQSTSAIPSGKNILKSSPLEHRRDLEKLPSSWYVRWQLAAFTCGLVGKAGMRSETFMVGDATETPIQSLATCRWQQARKYRTQTHAHAFQTLTSLFLLQLPTHHVQRNGELYPWQDGPRPCHDSWCAGNEPRSPCRQIPCQKGATS